MRWRPRFVFDDQDFTLELPVAPWELEENVVGGSAESAARIVAAFTVRRDYALIIPLRFYEAEWPLIRRLIEYGQTGAPLAWYPAFDEVTSYEIYLDSPEVGREYETPPDGTYPRALSLAIVVARRGTNSDWDDLPDYFDGLGDV